MIMQLDIKEAEKRKQMHLSEDKQEVL